MPIVEWKVRDLIGVEELDRHHKHLVQLLNANYDSFRAGADVEKSVFEELVEHAACLFVTEEAWMGSSDYPEFEAHKKEHEFFISKMELLRKSPQKYRSVEAIWFLCSWITHHFRGTDAKFGKFLALQGMSKAV